eukprot:1161685-Pelagomonas_calceolata.AAC.17
MNTERSGVAAEAAGGRALEETEEGRMPRGGCRCWTKQSAQWWVQKLEKAERSVMEAEAKDCRAPGERGRSFKRQSSLG